MAPEETETCIRLIRKLSEEFGLTILFCEHDMGLVFEIARRVMVMVRGGTVVQGAARRCAGTRKSRTPTSGVRLMLEVRGIHTYYGQSHILFDVSLALEKARSWGCWGGTGPARPPR